MYHHNQLIEQIFFVAKDISTGKEEFYEVNEQYISLISPYIRNSEATNILLNQLYAILDKIIDRLARSSLTIKCEPASFEQEGILDTESQVYMNKPHNNNNEDSTLHKSMYITDEGNYSENLVGYNSNNLNCATNDANDGNEYMNQSNTMHTNFDTNQETMQIHQVPFKEEPHINQSNTTKANFDSNQETIHIHQVPFKEEPNINDYQFTGNENVIERMIHDKIKQIFRNEDKVGDYPGEMVYEYADHIGNSFQGFNTMYNVESEHNGLNNSVVRENI